MIGFGKFVCMMAIALWAVPAGADEVPADAVGFTVFLAKAFQNAQPNAGVTIAGPLHLTIKQNGETWETYLYTIYSYCLRNSKDLCAEAVALHVEEIAASC